MYYEGKHRGTTLSQATEDHVGKHRAKCWLCDTTGTIFNPMYYGPDPYCAEIYEDNSPRHLCRQCHNERWDEI